MLENGFGIIISRFRVLLGTIEQKQKVVKDIVLTCVVLYNMRRTQGGEDRSPIQENDVAALINEQVVYVPDDNSGNFLKEAKHQPHVLKDYFNHLGTLAGQGQDLR